MNTGNFQQSSFIISYKPPWIQNQIWKVIGFDTFDFHYLNWFGIRKMLKTIDGLARKLVGILFINMHRILFRILSVGPIPNHIAFTLDEHWRYAEQQNVAEGTGYRAGFLALMSMLKYCYELGVKYMTINAFSIDNFRSSPEEVQYLMDLILEKIEGILEQESIINEYGVRIHFVGNLKLLDEPVRVAAEKAMQATANYTKSNVLMCGLHFY